MIDSDDEGPAVRGSAAAAAGAEGPERVDAAADARAKKREEMKAASKERNKVESQLGKIQKIFEDKGFGNEGAFSRGERAERGERGGPNRSERRRQLAEAAAEQPADMHSIPAKKRRI